MEIGVSKISSKGQVVIPRNIRSELKLKKDEFLVFLMDKDEILIKPARDVIDIKLKSKDIKDYLIALRQDQILSEMEEGKYYSLEEVF